MYKLNLENKQNFHKTQWTYDEKYSNILNENNSLVVIDNKWLEYKNINIRITPGMECNNSCKYCQQAFVYTKESFCINISDEYIEKYCVSILNMLKRNFNDLETYRIRFSFWGGEPLLYFDTIKKIVSKLKIIFNGYDIVFGIVTNGITLTNEVVDYILSNNISNINLSYDGPGQVYCRNVHLFNNNNFVSNIIRLLDNNKLSFLPVFSKYNSSALEWVRELKTHIGNYAYKAKVMDFVYVKPTNETTLNMKCSKEEIENNTKDFISHIDNYNIEMSPYDLYIELVTAPLLRSLLKTDIEPACAMSREQAYSMDLKGTVWKCHNFIDYKNKSNYIIGNIFDNTFKKTKFDFCRCRHEYCDTCLQNAICNGGCPLGVKHPDIICFYRYNIQLPAFYNAIKIITNDTYRLTSIDKC